MNAIEERLLIGGQAVIEGVMMRSPRWTSVVVRTPDGAIAAFTEGRVSPLVRYRWLRLPVLRGVIALYEALAIGVRALLRSAGVAAGANQPLTPRRSEEHTSELQSPCNLVCRLLLEKKKTKIANGQYPRPQS